MSERNHSPAGKQRTPVADARGIGYGIAMSLKPSTVTARPTGRVGGAV